MGSEAHALCVDAPSDWSQILINRIDELEQCWSRFVPSSEVCRLNLASGSPVVVSDDTLLLVETMICAWQLSGGLFNPTVLPRVVWSGYRSSKHDAEQVSALPDIDLGWGLELDQITIDRTNQTIALPLGMTIDPGAIGKGLAADIATTELIAMGAKGALLSIGGDVATSGQPPTQDGWSISIEDPWDRASPLCYLAVQSGGVATSSTRSRTWRFGGIDRHHIINPHTGMHSTTEIASVTVFASSGWASEIHATALIIGGKDEFQNYTTRHQLDAILLSSKGETIMTNSLHPLDQADEAAAS